MSRRIAFISEHASPLALNGGVDTGGQNIFVGQMAKHLARMGNSVDVFTRKDSPDLPRTAQLAPGVRVIHLTAGPERYVRKEDMLPLMTGFTARLVGECKASGGYDILHANFWMSALAAAEVKRLLGIPFVVTFHALGRVRRSYLREADEFPEERLSIEDRAIAEADSILPECPEDEADLIRLYGANPAKMTIVPCGFDPGEFFPVSKNLARRATGLPQDQRLLFHAGRIIPRKGVDNVIRGLGQLVHEHATKARLVIAGAGLEEPDPRVATEVQRLLSIAEAERVEDLVSFVGYVERERLKYYYSAADLFVTTPWYEPFGITPLEAMACGTPAIGSNVGGIKYTVRDGETGYLVEPNDPEALGERAAALFNHPMLLERFRQRAAEHVGGSFSWQRAAHAAAAVYEDVLCSQPGHRGYRDAAAVIDKAFTGVAEAASAATVQVRHSVYQAAEGLSRCFAQGGKVLVCGNGGSAAEAQHFAGEFVGRFKETGRAGLPVIALTADSAVVTGWSNDMGYDNVFARQVEALGKPGDMLVAISTSGNSPNLKHAFEAARARGIRCLSLCAGDGGEMHKLDDLSIILPTTDPQRAQEMQLVVVHLLCQLVENAMSKNVHGENNGAQVLTETGPWRNKRNKGYAA
ncbi:MAG: glycosyltransferase [Dehalococcoidia bacterium]